MKRWNLLATDLAPLAVVFLALTSAELNLGGPIVALSTAAAGALLIGVHVVRGRWPLAPALGAAFLTVAAVWLALGSPAAEILHGLAFLGLVSTSYLVWKWPIPQLPVPSGTHRIGVRILEPNLQVDGESTSARSQVFLWYPARNEGAKRYRPLRTKQELEGYKRAMKGIGGKAHLFDAFAFASTHSTPDAAAENGSFPLVVFNHGGAMTPISNWALMEELASNGYIVCSVGHPGDSLALVWSDGTATELNANRLSEMQMAGSSLETLARYHLSTDEDERRALLPELEKAFENSLTRFMNRWADQSIEAVAYLRGLSQFGDAAVQAIDFTRLAYVGMSLGGAVSVECCFRDPAARACINLDGMIWAFSRLYKEIPVPVLQVYGDPTLLRPQLEAVSGQAGAGGIKLTARSLMSNDFFYEAPATRGRRQDVVRIAVPGAGHMAFTDYALAARGPARALIGTGNAEGEWVSKALSELSCEFLNRYVKHNREGSLERTLLKYPDLVRQRLTPLDVR